MILMPGATSLRHALHEVVLCKSTYSDFTDQLNTK
jgi:hypothetical protein